jgi:hypothetical protein
MEAIRQSREMIGAQQLCTIQDTWRKERRKKRYTSHDTPTTSINFQYINIHKSLYSLLNLSSPICSNKYNSKFEIEIYKKCKKYHF